MYETMCDWGEIFFGQNLKPSFGNMTHPKKVFYMNSVQNPGWLGDIRDDTTQLY